MPERHACPSCGETEALHGRPVDEDIELACERCGTTWLRGGPRCRSCGGTDIATRPQTMARTPRGNQLAIVGRRDIPLCRTCDQEALEVSIATNRPVPEGYVSACLAGPRPEPPSSAETRPTPASPSLKPSRPSRAPSRGPVPLRRRPTPRPALPDQPPTVRKAVEAFMTELPDTGDGSVLLLLGAELGPATRLGELDQPGTDARLEAWVERMFGSRRGDTLATGRGTVITLVDYWRERGWLTGDPAALLRD